ncbi:MAG: tyrosine-type recombinase/integrase [Candidatus Xenobia bacterium]
MVHGLAQRAGLGGHRTAQALRRGLGTRMLETGAELPQIALVLGHELLESTRPYLRVSMIQLQEVADHCTLRQFFRWLRRASVPTSWRGVSPPWPPASVLAR